MSHHPATVEYEQDADVVRILFEIPGQSEQEPKEQTVFDGWVVLIDPKTDYIVGHQFPDFTKNFSQVYAKRVEFPLWRFPIKGTRDEKNIHMCLMEKYNEILAEQEAAAKAAAAAKAPAAAAPAAGAAAPAAGAAPAEAPAAAAAVALTVVIKGEEHTIEIPSGGNMLDEALERNIDIEFDCKAGVCDTCEVKVLSGADSLSAPTDEEFIMLGEDKVNTGGCRLSCQVTVHGPVTVQQG